MLENELNFIKEFVELDYLVRKAKWTESNDDIFVNLLNELENYYNRNIRSGIYREVPVLPETLKEGQKYLKNLQKKKIFQIKQYSYEKYSNLFSAYLSSQFLGDNTYFTKNYFAFLENRYQILSNYIICDNCNGTGIINDRQCDECSGDGWTWQGGIKINIQIKPSQVIKLLKPSNFFHLKEYKSE